MVGLYNGANMGLLKTVLEVNLQLFQHTGYLIHLLYYYLQYSSVKTLLCFVIRDFTGMTPLEALAETLKADLTRIWSELRKPAGKESSQITDYFDFAFNGLPHKVYAAQQFKDEVQKLKDKYLNPLFLLSISDLADSTIRPMANTCFRQSITSIYQQTDSPSLLKTFGRRLFITRTWIFLHNSNYSPSSDVMRS